MKTELEKLTDKEEETLTLLWEFGPYSVKELLEHFSEPKPHINTLSTFVRSLEHKGYVDHVPGRYGGFNYFAIQSKSDYRRGALRKVVKRFFGNAFSLASNLVEEQQLDDDELRQLLEMIENKKKGAGK